MFHEDPLPRVCLVSLHTYNSLVTTKASFKFIVSLQQMIHEYYVCECMREHVLHALCSAFLCKTSNAHSEK